MNETPLLDKTASSKTQPRFFFKEYNVLFDTFRSRTAFVVSRSHALNQEIYRIEPQSRTVDQLRSWIALMHEIIKERDILKEEIVLQREKIEKRFKGLDVESGWRREHEEALSQRIEGLKEMLHFYEKEELQRLQQEAEIKTRINEGSDVVSAPEPIDMALAKTESSIETLLSTYRKAEISSLNSTLTAQPYPAPYPDAWPNKKSAFLAIANETKRARKDYVRTMKDEAEMRAMLEIKGAIGTATRDLYRNSSAAVYKENQAIVSSAGAAGEDKQIPLLDPYEENTPVTTITTTTRTRTGAKVPISDNDKAIVAGNSKYAFALWSLVPPLVYIFLILLVRSLFWIFSFLTAEAE